MRESKTVWLGAIATILGAGALSAQTLVRGRVMDSETGAPLVGAHVRLGGKFDLTTDSLGRFSTTALSPGRSTASIRLLGYSPGTFEFRVRDRGDQDETFSLDYNGQQLPMVSVSARAEQMISRYSDFEMRRQRGLGTFLRWDQLVDGKYVSVGDALRMVSGVRINCDQRSFECRAYMARSPRCEPTWIIDGMEAASFHENTPIKDVYGIEVYRGASEVPGEYGGSKAGCGVIVLWTKSRPYRANP
jgi:hypothetical protein